MSSPGAVRLAAVAAVAVSVLAGCDLPRDPEGTLDRVRGGTIRIGVTAREPWTDWPHGAADRRPAGVEVELAERFAKELGAEVAWVRGSETELLTALENFDLDLALAGLTDDTLWSDRIGLTRPYYETAEGKHVFAAPPGENDFLLTLDEFLAGQEAAVRARLAAEGPVPEKAAVK